jgi:hypothetical protein
MDSSPLLLALALALAVALPLLALRLRSAKRKAQRRTAALRLMDCLKVYSAWVDWHRDEPLLHQNPEELSLPPALAQATQIRDQWLPELSGLLVKLLQTHRELMVYFWEENLLRMTQASLRPYYADPRYHHLRDLQDAALDSLLLRCRQLIGEEQMVWHRTRSDFSFSSSLNLPSPPSMPK